MTFIASVIAKKGVAIIADSLVTSSIPVIDYEDFFSYISAKEQQSENDQITLDADEIRALFKEKPSFTKDYEEKLFKYDKFTAVTTAGAAVVGGRRIEALISEITALNQADENYEGLTIKDKVEAFVSFIRRKVIDHIKKFGSINTLIFLVTHYDVATSSTVVYRIEVFPSNQADLKTPENLIGYRKMEEFIKAICEGQNRTSEKVLYGDYLSAFQLVPAIARRIIEDFKIREEDIPEGYIESLLADQSIITQAMLDEIKITKLNELSLQQAVELAALLMHIEMDLQKYTENIPTVGGVIKLAVIDKSGFRFVSGEKITKPNNL